MLKNKALIFIFICIIFALSFIVLFSDIMIYDSKKEIIEISVISRMKNIDGWATINQGIDQAANDMGIDISFVTLTNYNNLDEQISFINREINNGTNAIVLSAGDSDGLAKYFESINCKIPIVTIESDVDSDKILAYFSANNYEMGVKLGDKILQLESDEKNVAIITSSMQCSNIKQRYHGLIDSLESIKNTLNICEMKSNSKENIEVVKNMIIKNDIDILIAPDLIGLEFSAQLSETFPELELDIFGIGSTSNIVSYLERGIITALIVQNDFSVGYLGAEAAFNAVKNKNVTKNMKIEYRLITSDDMYERENQRLLFPFIR